MVSAQIETADSKQFSNRPLRNSIKFVARSLVPLQIIRWKQMAYLSA